MKKLAYTFTNDILFKMLFVKYPDLLKRLVAELLGIKYESIEQFEITNPEIPPETIGDKFCRLDINMIVNGQMIDLEIQVHTELNYPDRSLYYWAKEFSASLAEGGDYSKLPRTVVISILAFKLFDCEEFHSEFRPLEVTRHTQLTDKQVLHYFELPKLPKEIDAADERSLWLALFRAETEEDLIKLEKTEAHVMNQAIEAYRQITAEDRFKEIERMRSRARHDEASALRHAAEVAAEAERGKWQVIVADKDSEIKKLRELLDKQQLSE